MLLELYMMLFGRTSLLRELYAVGTVQDLSVRFTKPATFSMGRALDTSDPDNTLAYRVTFSPDISMGTNLILSTDARLTDSGAEVTISYDQVQLPADLSNLEAAVDVYLVNPADSSAYTGTEATANTDGSVNPSQYFNVSHLGTIATVVIEPQPYLVSRFYIKNRNNDYLVIQDDDSVTLVSEKPDSAYTWEEWSDFISGADRNQNVNHNYTGDPFLVEAIDPDGNNQQYIKATSNAEKFLFVVGTVFKLNTSTNDNSLFLEAAPLPISQGPSDPLYRVKRKTVDEYLSFDLQTATFSAVPGDAKSWDQWSSYLASITSPGILYSNPVISVESGKNYIKATYAGGTGYTAHVSGNNTLGKSWVDNDLVLIAESA
jgi:hypothetical protein